MPPLETVNVPPATSAGSSDPLARARGEIGDTLVDRLERERVGAGHHRRNHPVRRVDGNRDVDLGEELDVRLRHPRVEDRMSAERRRDELYNDRRDADPGRRSSFVELRSKVDQRLDVQLEHRGQLCGRLQARDHAVRDRPAPAAQWNRAVNRQAPGTRRRRRRRAATTARRPTPRRRDRGCAHRGPSP